MTNCEDIAYIVEILRDLCTRSVLNPVMACFGPEDSGAYRMFPEGDLAETRFRMATIVATPELINFALHGPQPDVQLARSHATGANHDALTLAGFSECP